MKTVKFELNGQPFFLCFNGAAFFALQEKFGEGFNIGTLLAETNGKYDTLCELLSLLSEQGELTRRYLGYAPADIPAPEFFAVTLSPLDALRAKKEVLDALRLGFARDVKDTQGIDLYELEYQKKRARPECLAVHRHADAGARAVRPRGPAAHAGAGQRSPLH